MTEKVPCIGPFVFGKCKHCELKADEDRGPGSSYETLACHPHRVEAVCDETELFLGTHRIVHPDGTIFGYLNMTEDHGS